jgi:hypothetical protein
MTTFLQFNTIFLFGNYLKAELSRSLFKKWNSVQQILSKAFSEKQSSRWSSRKVRGEFQVRSPHPGVVQPVPALLFPSHSFPSFFCLYTWLIYYFQSWTYIPVPDSQLYISGLPDLVSALCFSYEYQIQLIYGELGQVISIFYFLKGRQCGIK